MSARLRLCWKEMERLAVGSWEANSQLLACFGSNIETLAPSSLSLFPSHEEVNMFITAHTPPHGILPQHRSRRQGTMEAWTETIEPASQNKSFLHLSCYSQVFYSNKMLTNTIDFMESWVRNVSRNNPFWWWSECFLILLWYSTSINFYRKLKVNILLPSQTN